LCYSFLHRPARACKTSVLRIISTSSGEGGGNEKPIVRSELKTVLEEIKEAKSTLAKYEAWFENEEKSVTAEMVTMAQRALNLLREEKARLDAPSLAPSCATGVVRKHFFREGGGYRVACLLRSFGPCDLNRVEVEIICCCLLLVFKHHHHHLTQGTCRRAAVRSQKQSCVFSSRH
jgi:hypothetical protein